MTILVVDDEPGIRDVLKDILEDESYSVALAEDGLVASAMLEQLLVDCVLLDVWLPGKGGLELLAEILDTYPTLPVVMISGHGTIEMAVQAVKRGAFDFLEKPLGLDKVVAVVRNALQLHGFQSEQGPPAASRTEKPPRRGGGEASSGPAESSGVRLIGESGAMQRVRGLISQTAHTDARVLISGENGTGKELAARTIHELSGRREGPFVAVNCAAIPESLIESELFGHEKGAFTGAQQSRRGKFEAAHRGTLFLDEIGDMALAAQAKVLRVIQEMRFERLGGERSVVVDVRVLAASNRDLQVAIADGTFREDLYFRLNVVPVHMPALRERTADIPALIQSINPTLVFSEEAKRRLQEHDWPGNVRELKNFCERVSILLDKAEVSEADVTQHLGRGAARQTPSGLEDYMSMGLNEARERFERQFLEEKLREHGNNISRTAQALGMYPSNLHAKIRKLNIEVDR